MRERVHLKTIQCTRKTFDNSFLMCSKVPTFQMDEELKTAKYYNGPFMCLIVWLGNCFGGPFSCNITILTECYPDCKARLPSLTQLSTGTDILCSIEMTIKLGGSTEENVSETQALCIMSRKRAGWMGSFWRQLSSKVWMELLAYVTLNRVGGFERNIRHGPRGNWDLWRKTQIKH